jgi:hypothetical protein
MLCAAGMILQQIAGKATRDTLFLTNFDVTSLPYMLIASAAVSLAAVFIASRGLSLHTPARFVPIAFTVSAVLQVGEWWLLPHAPRPAAVIIYLHIAVLGSVLISAFWSLVSELFDPRSAKRFMGRIAAGGAAGGVAGGIIAERMAATQPVATMLLVLAGAHLLCAFLARGLAVAPTQTDSAAEGDAPTKSADPASASPDEDSANQELGSGLRVLQRDSYLRNLAILVVLGTVSAAILDYVLKVQATQSVRSDAGLLRFFALFYMTTGVLTFLIQAVLGQRALEKLGIARTVASHAVAVGATAAGTLISPSLASATIARGAESVLRSSLYRSGYELFFLPIPPAEKRATKGLIDVGAERAGDAAGGGVVKLAQLLAPQVAISALLSLAVLLAVASLLIARRLHVGYVQSLERQLVDGAMALEMADATDNTTKTILLRRPSGDAHSTRDLSHISSESRRFALPQPWEAEHTMFIPVRSFERSHARTTASGSAVAERGTSGGRVAEDTSDITSPGPKIAHKTPDVSRPGDARVANAGARPVPGPPPQPSAGPRPPAPRRGGQADREVSLILDLRSADPPRIRQALAQLKPLPRNFAPWVIELLAWDQLAPDAIAALRETAPRIVGQLVDALLDPNAEFAIRRRIPRILVASDDPLAIRGLLRGLEDKRFEVRYQCGRALARIRARKPEIELDSQAVFAVALREVRVDRSVWESHRLLDLAEEKAEDGEAEAAPLDAVVRERSNRSMEHLFTILSLALPAQPLLMAYRALGGEDTHLRGTALEYLESVLPNEIRDSLWPFLEDTRTGETIIRPREQIIDDLLRANQSMQINLRELRQVKPQE